MTRKLQNDRDYYLYLNDLQQHLAPSGRDEIETLATDLIKNRALPDGIAAIVFGLTGIVGELDGSYQYLFDQVEAARIELKTGNTSEAAKLLARVTGDVSELKRLNDISTNPIALMRKTLKEE